jgi:hypothetical protein
MSACTPNVGSRKLRAFAARRDLQGTSAATSEVPPGLFSLDQNYLTSRCDERDLMKTPGPQPLEDIHHFAAGHIVYAPGALGVWRGRIVRLFDAP